MNVILLHRSTCTTAHRRGTTFIDACLQQVIESINKIPRYRTMLSCCGHDVYPASILVLDKETNTVFEWYSGKRFPRRCKNGRIKRRYYKKDDAGYYYLEGLGSLVKE